MFTVLSNVRNANLYLIVASGLVLIVLLGMLIAPSIAMRGPALVPMTGSENAYVQFLQGEKVIFPSPAGVSQALSAYHLGEKAIYTKAVDTSSALTAYHLGEKAIVRFEALESALWEYRLGEKGLK